MAVRALIIAVEHYPAAQGLGGLPGTLDAAMEFADCLRQDMGADPDDIIVCRSGTGLTTNQHPATRSGVEAALDSMLRRAKDQAEQLFVYLAGHGLQVRNRGWRAPDDVLLLSDFVSTSLSGANVVQVMELQRRLALGLGPGVQFCFVDACRTDAPDGFEPLNLGIATVRSDRGEACSHRLTSARPGGRALATRDFANALLSGLRGQGKLHTEPDGQTWVTLQGLAEGAALALRAIQGEVDLRMECADDRIRSVAGSARLTAEAPHRPSPESSWIPTLSGPVPTVGVEDGIKSPPVELLVRYDRIVFLGETNSQLPRFLREAAEIRRRPWRRIDILSLSDYRDHGRIGCSAADLERERDMTEVELREILSVHAETFELYRYEYVGVYGSLWEHDETGVRRVHTSPRVRGLDIRSSPATDLVEIPGSPSKAVQHFFDLADDLIRTTPPLDPSMHDANANLIIGASHLRAGIEATTSAAESGLPVAQQAALARIAGELTNAEVDADVLSAPDDEMAALFQAFLEEKAAEQKLETVDAIAGGREVKFDDHDLLGWAGSFFTWITGLKKHHWIVPNASADPIPNRARVAILGDWGSGLYAAPVIAKTIEEDRTPYEVLVHLGDVYYAGTKHAVRKRFLRYWPSRPEAISRACNANHEMYPGGHAYFEDILGNFDQPASPFALQNDHWLVVGLDSAYEDHDLANGQVEWLDQLLDAAGPRKVVLLSHHQPLSLFEKQGGKLVARLRPVLEAKKILAWYWGHEHRCVLHERHAEWAMWGRCIGHSGYPYFREDLHGVETSRVGEHRWVRVDGPAGVPSGVVLDGPNEYVAKKAERYGPQGYATLSLDGPRLTERVHAATGDILHEKELQ